MTELKRIAGNLRSARPTYYRRMSGRITPRFADDVLKLCRALTPLKEVFSRTIRQNDSGSAQQFRSYLVELRIPEELRNVREEFTYEMMREKVVEPGKRESAMQEIDKRFRACMATLSSSASASHDRLFDELEKLANLTEFEFHPLLSRFDSSFDVESLSSVSRFAAVRAEDVVSELKDLYFVVRPVRITQEVAQLVFELSARRTGTDETSKRDVARMVGSVAQCLQKTVTADVLANVVRVATEDPYLQLEYDLREHAYLGEYIDALKLRFEKNKERCAREAIEEGISRDFSSLFGKISLLQMRGYNEEESSALASGGFARFSHVRPLRIVKSYLLARYEGDCKRTIGKLVADGVFANMAFKDSLAKASSSCDNVLQGIERFEEDASGIGSHSLSAIHELQDRKQRGDRVDVEINKIIDALNKTARRLADEGTGHLYTMARLLKDTLEDHRTTSPTYVLNIRGLGGTANREFVADLTRGYNDIVKFVRIMKSFAVLDADSFARAITAKTGQDGRSK